MSKFQPYSRSKLQGLQRTWLGDNRAMIAGLATGTVGLLGFETFLFVVVNDSGHLGMWLLGVLQAVTVAVLVHMLYIGFLVHDRQALYQLRGAWGEENTRDVLRRAKRKRLIWGSVDSIGLQIGDVDHFVVSRRGGLVVLDSKWRSDATDVADMARAAARVRTRAEGVTRSHFDRDRTARHRDKTNPLAVTPVVVLWGPLQHTVPNGARIDGIEFVAGKRLMTWLASLDGDPVDREMAADLLVKLEEFRAQIAAATSSR